MIWIRDLAEELKLHPSTVSYWLNHEIDCDPQKTRIKGKLFISEEAAQEIRNRKDQPIEHRGFGNAKKDINENWRKGFPTRIGY